MSEGGARGGQEGEEAAAALPPTPNEEAPQLLWHVQTPDGVTRKVTLDQLNDAFQAGRVDATLRVRAPGAAKWSTLGELASLKEDAPAEATPAPASAPAPRPPPAPAPPVPAAPVPVVEAAPAPSPDIDLRVKRPRPVMGPALTLLGVLLWAFVVIGTFTTSWLSGGAPLGEGAAKGLVAVVVLVAWTLAVRRSRSVPMRGRRGLITRSAAVGLLALALWGSLVSLTTVVGKASTANVDPFVTAFLLIAAAVAVFSGHRMTMAVRSERTRGRRLAVVALWVGVAVVTLGACAEIVGET